MSLLLKKYRKGVSPVIAVVLLIALTVAAAAVIWTLTSGILDDADPSSITVSVSAASSDGTLNTINLTLTIDADEAGTVTDIKILAGPAGYTAGNGALDSPDQPITKGSASYTFDFSGFGALTQGEYTFQIIYNFGGDPKTLDFKRSLSPT